MAKGIKNIAASVHQRLLNKAKEGSRPYHGEYNRREVSSHGEAWGSEQPNEGFLRHLGAVP